MTATVPLRASVPGLNASMILIAIEDILGAIQPSRAPRLTTAGASVPFSSAVAQVRRTRRAPSASPTDAMPFIGVRRTQTSVENFPANRLRATMTVEMDLHVAGSDLYEAEAALHALEDDVIAAMYSGFRMTPGYPDGDGPNPYAHDVNLEGIEDLQIDETETQAASMMTWTIVYSRDTGKEAGHTGYIP